MNTIQYSLSNIQSLPSSCTWWVIHYTVCVMIEYIPLDLFLPTRWGVNMTYSVTYNRGIEYILSHLNPSPVKLDIPVGQLINKLNQSWHYRIESVTCRGRGWWKIVTIDTQQHTVHLLMYKCQQALCEWHYPLVHEVTACVSGLVIMLKCNTFILIIRKYKYNTHLLEVYQHVILNPVDTNHWSNIMYLLYMH